MTWLISFWLGLLITIASQSKGPNDNGVMNYFNELYSYSIEKQIESGYTPSKPRYGTISGLPWIEKSTPITGPEIINNVLLSLHHQLLWLVLHEDGLFDETKHGISPINAIEWTEARDVILGWDVLLGYHCAKALMTEVEHLKHYLTDNDYRHPDAPEHPELYHWADYHIGAHIGRTLSTCMDRCPDPEFLHYEMRKNLNENEKNEDESIEKRIIKYMMERDYELASDQQTVEDGFRKARTENKDHKNKLSSVRVPVFCLDWADVYLRTDPNLKDSTIHHEEL